MWAAPECAVKTEAQLEYADVDGIGSPGAYANVALAGVVGPSSITNGIVVSTNTDASPLAFGKVGSKRFVMLTLQPTGL